MVEAPCDICMHEICRSGRGKSVLGRLADSPSPCHVTVGSHSVFGRQENDWNLTGTRKSSWD